MSKEKTRSLSLRISDALFNTFENIKKEHAEIGEKKSVSEIARERLERPVADDAYSLHQDESGTLRFLREKIMCRGTLSREHWNFLSSMAHDTYAYSKRNRYDSRLLANALRAFGDFIELRDQYHGTENIKNNYYLSNLMNPKEASGIVNVQTALQHTLLEIEKEPTTKVGAEFMMRNLEVALRDEPTIPEAELHDCLYPYAETLLTLAAKAYYTKPHKEHVKRKSYMPLDFSGWSEMWNENFEEEGFKLQTLRSSNSFSMLLSVESGWFQEDSSFNYTEMEEFIYAVQYCISSDGYEVTEPSSYGGKRYVVIMPGSRRWYLEQKQFDSLRTLLNRYLSNKEIQRIRKYAHLIYGGI